MAFAVAIPSRTPVEHRDLAFWMKRTLRELAELPSNPPADAVHDLRVSLRRCRSVAAAVEEIDPHPNWQEMRSCARKLFRSMGELRDAQILEGWLQELQPEEDALKNALRDSLKQTQESATIKVQHSAGKFAEKRWYELARSLHARLRMIPADGTAARCLALERLEEAKELHRRALRTENPKPWHALRIGLKRFRYTLELLVPSLHAKWVDSLKRVQDLLGDVHDLDMLLEAVNDLKTERASYFAKDWETRIAGVRQEKLQTYRQVSLGQASIWQDWHSGFPRQDMPAYSAARIAATRAAMDPKPGKSLAVSRIALKLWSQLRTCGTASVLADANERRVLQAAARLSGIQQPARKKSRVKSARTFLLHTPVPPDWSFAEWERVAWSIRFQRGAEPGSGKKRFSRLSIEQQASISLLAGILRLAVAAHRCGITSGAAIKMETLPQALLLHVHGVEETPAIAARFTEAKHLLERSLGKTILVQPANQLPPPVKRVRALSPVAGIV